jgi:SNF2 family DNA or RNA helicase
LSEQQKDLYRQAVEERGLGLRQTIQDSTTTRLPYLKIIAVLQYLKQICNHPSQLARSTDYTAYESGKWSLFVEILEECRASSLKVVVFSQYTAMLDIIERYLADQGVTYRALRGSMPPSVRQRNIDEFNRDAAITVFTASLLAGGVGIDLTGAQAIIHYDRWWNAAKEEQASARVHRLGQRQEPAAADEEGQAAAQREEREQEPGTPSFAHRSLTAASRPPGRRARSRPGR